MAATIEQIRQAAEDWSIEVTPTGANKIESFAIALLREQRLTLPFCQAVIRWIRSRWRDACMMMA